ncbi:MAG: hypothetical protein LBI82_06890 [Dysgonamonadaceae bacterium]|nr:hypothetical protein [Dysgonamonadaceae bacterium]
MKIATYILVFVVSFYGLSVSAQEADTLNHIPKETKRVEPIGFDQKTYDQFKNDKAYDYYQGKPESSFFDAIYKFFHDWLRKNFNPNVTLKQVKITLWVIAGIVVIIILLIIYFYKPSLFYINRKKKIGFEVEDEDIHALDFDKLIEESLDSGRFSDAIRWTYLLTLKELHTKELISWDAFKTVIEYTYELKQPNLKQDFKNLSQQFLYYRYGNFDATHDAYSAFSALSNSIIKRL